MFRAEGEKKAGEKKTEPSIRVGVNKRVKVHDEEYMLTGGRCAVWG